MAVSIWLRPERAGRGPSPAFDRGRIAAAGVALADADGLAAVTMRAVADSLGAAPASLYRYVATRDELLELMVDQANGEVSYDGLGAGDWLEDLLALAREARERYRAHPWLLDGIEAKIPLGPRATDFLEHALAACAAASVEPGTAIEAVAVMLALVGALTRAELGRRAIGLTDSERRQAKSEYAAQIVKAGDHPHVAAALASRAAEPATDPDVQFDRVVTRVLIGLLGGR